MTTLQRIKKLERDAQAAAAYCFSTIYLPGHAESYYSGLWQDFGNVHICMRGEFFDTQSEAESWLVRELAGQASPVFYIESVPEFRLVKTARYATGAIVPAQLDQALWETANREGCLYV
jgi:hypothetical protein